MEKEGTAESLPESDSTETNEPPEKKEETVEALPESKSTERTNEPPEKRRRLSLSLKKNKGRFGAPVDKEQVMEASKGVVPENTKRRNQWALRNFSQWMENRNRHAPNDVIPQDILHVKIRPF